MQCLNWSVGFGSRKLKVGYLQAYEFKMQGFGVLLVKNTLSSVPKSTITLGACYFNSPATKAIS